MRGSFSLPVEDRAGTTIRSAVINKAINYIFDHIDEDITVDDVARHCAYSKYHLTRMFKEDTDEALYQFIKRVRLERSAWRLKVEKEKSITEIGGEYGYSSSNFATAFKKHLEVSPADFRRISEQMVERMPFIISRGSHSFYLWCIRRYSADGSQRLEISWTKDQFLIFIVW